MKHPENELLNNADKTDDQDSDANKLSKITK